MSETLQGKRVADGTGRYDLQIGEYCKSAEPLHWSMRLPNGMIGDIKEGIHTVTVHEDNTITVSPSILMSAGDPKYNWHGYLEHGVFRSC
jgi:hypothetical protein